MELTISGPIGSGKSTVARLLSSTLGMKYLSTGDIFRENAAKHGMTVEAFNEYAEKHPEVDMEQDSYLIEKMRSSDGLVIDSRLAGWLSFRNGIPAFRVYITASIAVRIKRIANRENIDEAVASALLERREKSEAKRYMSLYSIDISDTSIYNVTLDTSALDAESAAGMVVTRIRELSA